MDKGEEGSSDHWAEDRSHTTKEGHDNGSEGELNIEGKGGIDIILIGEMDRTCKSDEKGTEGEGNDFILGRMDAQGFCGLLIFTNGNQTKPKFRREDLITEDKGYESQQENRPVERRKTNACNKRDSLSTMGEGGKIFRAKELPRALCQCHHGDGKVDALNPKQNISDANGDETGEEGSDGPGQEP